MVKSRKISNIITHKRKKSIVKLVVSQGPYMTTFNGLPIDSIAEPYRVSTFKKFMSKFKKLKNYVYSYSQNGGGKLAAYESMIPCISRFAIENKIYDRLQILKYDAKALTTDPRYKWSKTPNGPGARSKYQKSYR